MELAVEIFSYYYYLHIFCELHIYERVNSHFSIHLTVSLLLVIGAASSEVSIVIQTKPITEI